MRYQCFALGVNGFILIIACSVRQLRNWYSLVLLVEYRLLNLESFLGGLCRCSCTKLLCRGVLGSRNSFLLCP